MENKIIPAEQQAELRTMARDLAQSNLIPDEFRGRPENVALALQYAQRVGVPALTVMRGMYVVRGKVGWYSEFMGALLNRSKVLRGPVDYIELGDGDEYRVRCVGVDAATGETREGQWISWALVKANGWDKNRAYATNGPTLFRRRALACFVRDYYPDVMLGVPTQEELDDALLAEGHARQAQVKNTANRYSAMGIHEEDIVDVTPEEPVLEEGKPLSPEENAELDRKIAQEEAETAADQAELNWGSDQ